MLREEFSARTWASRNKTRVSGHLRAVSSNCMASINRCGCANGKNPAVTTPSRWLQLQHTSVAALQVHSSSNSEPNHPYETQLPSVGFRGGSGDVHLEHCHATATEAQSNTTSAPTIGGTPGNRIMQLQGRPKHHAATSALGGLSADSRLRHVLGPSSSACTTSVGSFKVADRAGLFSGLGGGLRRHVACSAVGAVAGTAAVVAALYRSAAAVMTASGTAAVAVGVLGGAVVGEVLLATARDEDVETDRDVERGMEEAAEKVIEKLRDAKAKGRLRRHLGAHRRQGAQADSDGRTSTSNDDSGNSDGEA